MNIGGMIKGLKQKVRDRETDSAVKVANELKTLKVLRVRRNFISFAERVRADELSKTQKAKVELKQLKKGSKKKNVGSDTFFANDSPNAWFPK